MISNSGRGRVWHIDQDAHDLVRRLKGLLANRTMAQAYAVADRHRFDGNIDVVLLLRGGCTLARRQPE